MREGNGWSIRAHPDDCENGNCDDNGESDSCGREDDHCSRIVGVAFFFVSRFFPFMIAITCVFAFVICDCMYCWRWWQTMPSLHVPRYSNNTNICVCSRHLDIQWGQFHVYGALVWEIKECDICIYSPRHDRMLTNLPDEAHRSTICGE